MVDKSSEFTVCSHFGHFPYIGITSSSPPGTPILAFFSRRTATIRHLGGPRTPVRPLPGRSATGVEPEAYNDAHADTRFGPDGHDRRPFGGGRPRRPGHH